MRLINETAYATRELRAVLCAVHSADAPNRRGAPNANARGRLCTWKDLRVIVRYRRRGNRLYTGHAYFSGRRAMLSVPREQCDVRQLIALWRHELWHLYGIRHGDYPPSVLWCRVDGQFIDRVAAKVGREVLRPAPKARPDLEAAHATKVAALLERQRRWQTKHRRATNALAKIERALRRLGPVQGLAAGGATGDT